MDREETPRPGTDARALARKRALGAGAGALLGLALLIALGSWAVSSPVVCASCHEMRTRADAWAVSPHARVACVSCHVTPHAWYDVPGALAGRGELLARDVVRHFAGGYPDPVDGRLSGQLAMSDAVCLQCHDPNRKPTAGLGILIDHPKHAKRNGSCVSCHITVAHPKASRGTALSFMAQCFTCHGTGKSAKAPAKCSLCHPSTFSLRPASHDTKWKTAHGKVALADRSQCEMCHQKTFCDSCHGLEMPHPKGWAQRDGHPAYAERDRAVCSKCHSAKPDMCGMCHHKAYDPTRGTWVQQHYIEVQQRGAAACFDCHSPVYCARCHAEEVPPPSS